MSAVKQLIRDLKQLQKEPIVGANAEPYGDDMMKWYGIVVGPEGTPYEGIPIRFVLEFDNDYPNSAPKAFFDTEVYYEGGASYKVDGRLVVCLNIFGNFGHVHTEWKNQSSGWSPAYTVSTILITMQGSMIGDMLSKTANDIKITRESATKFICPITGHVGSDSTKWFPQVLLKMSDIIVDENKEITEEKKYDVLRDHYICYTTKQSKKDGAFLGYGINIDNPKIGTLSSPCEYLSETAFISGVRRSSTNKPFSYWIPILTHSSEWPKIYNVFLDSIKKIGSVINMGEKTQTYKKVIKICSSIMNSLVVEIMNNKNNLTANDKFVDGYFAFYRLLTQYAITDPEIVKFADSELKEFITKPEARVKNRVNNLGELLILLLVSNRYTWFDLCHKFIEECDARNVLWYCVGNRNSPATAPKLIDPNLREGRARLVFDVTTISRNLVMFQVKFSKIAKELTLQVMDSNNGLAPEELRVDMKRMYGKISTIVDWNEYFHMLSMPKVTDNERCNQLLKAMELSEKQGYHKANAKPQVQRYRYDNYDD